jgi:hypothetical protein
MISWFAKIALLPSEQLDARNLNSSGFLNLEQQPSFETISFSRTFLYLGGT